jgi:DNA-binding transcriptional ArsR family regulator
MKDAPPRRPGSPPAGGVVRDLEQLRALRSPLRQEILDKIEALGPCSTAELAHALGRPADGLYYHLRALLAVGLLEPAGDRGAGRRREALYRTRAAGEGLWLAYDPDDPANAAAVTAAVGGMLRLTERTFAAAFRPEAVCAGPRRNLWAARTEGWLSGDDLVELNVLLRRLRELFDRPRAEGRHLHAFTFVVAPMVVLDVRRRGRNGGGGAAPAGGRNEPSDPGAAGWEREPTATAAGPSLTPAAPPPSAPLTPPAAAPPPRRGTRGSARRRGR